MPLRGWAGPACYDVPSLTPRLSVRVLDAVTRSLHVLGGTVPNAHRWRSLACRRQPGRLWLITVTAASTDHRTVHDIDNSDGRGLDDQFPTTDDTVYQLIRRIWPTPDLGGIGQADEG
jgi:hypothetical protein